MTYLHGFSVTFHYYSAKIVQLNLSKKIVLFLLCLSKRKSIIKYSKIQNTHSIGIQIKR